MTKKAKLIRITTVPQSLRGLLEGQLSYMSKLGYEVIGVSSPGEILEEVKKNEEIKVVGIPMTRTISPIKDLQSLFRLYKLFKKEKPEIVHSHTPKAGILSMLTANLARVPFRLHTVAGMPLLVAKGKKRKLLNFVEKLTYKCATKVYPNSHGLSKIILDLNFIQKEKLKVIGKGSSNGIDTSYFNPDLISYEQKSSLRQKLGIQKEDYVYVYVGRIVKDKGINELVSSFNLINKKNKNVKLVLVGSFEKHLDPLKPYVEQIIETNENIITTGFQKDVRPYFAIADIFTFPTYREGFPNVLMQSCAMGIPSITTNINGCNEIITNNINGFVIEPQNEDQLKEKMLFGYENNQIIKRLKLNCRTHIVTNYERKYIWSEIAKEYKQLIN